MQVNNAKDALIISLGHYPTLNGTEIVANMDITCWLDTRKDTFFHGLLYTPKVDDKRQRPLASFLLQIIVYILNNINTHINPT